MKKVLALVMTLVMAAAMLASCAKTSSLDKIKKSGELVMLTNAQFAPYEYLGADNKPAGVDIDVAQAIADELGVKLTVLDMEFDGLVPALNGGKGDLVAAGLTITDEKKESVDFSDTYAQTTQVIIVNKEAPKVASVDDLGGKTVGVQLGTTGDFFVSMIDGVTVKQYKSGLEASMDLSNGKLDAVMLDKLTAQNIITNDATLTYIDEAFTDEEYAIAVKKGDAELLEVINSVLGKLIADGKIAEFTTKHEQAAIN
ncbi:MAG: transporter substrate-binding domain-containing protein [Clostridia bacterium]